ncbi:MAG: Wzz/FepE/Etk N-terminal domain-containing protein [Terracidiphilus sp.]
MEEALPEFTFLDLLLVLARRKHFILAFTAICAVLAGAVSLVLPKEYTATVTILPPQQNSSLSGTLAMQLAGLSSMSGLAGGGLGLKNLNDMYVAMLKSRSVEDAVIQQYGLMQEYDKKYRVDARKALERHTEIEGSSKDGLIRLSFENPNPSRAAAIANGYVDEFRTLSQHLAISEASQRRLVFQQQLDKTNKDLANAEEALKETELSTGMVQIDSQARAMIESAARLRAQVAAKQVQIEAMRTYAAPDNPALAQAEGELDGLRSQFAKLVGSSGNSANDLFLPKGEIPQAALEYVRKLRDVKYYEAIFDILARQLELAKLDEAKEGAFIQVVDGAVPPERKSFPKRLLITSAAAAGGLSLAIIIVLLQTGLNRMRIDPVKSEKLFLLKQALRRRAKQAPYREGAYRGRVAKRNETGDSRGE